MRLIFILQHSLLPFVRHKFTEQDVIFFDDWWHTKYALHLKKEYPSIEIECWRPEFAVSKEIYWTDSYGILHRIFPSWYLTKRHNYEFSPWILKAAKTISDKNTIIELHGIYNFIAYGVLSLNLPFPIMGQSHGGLPGKTLLRLSKKPFLRYIYYIHHVFEKFLFQKFSCIFTISNHERQEIMRYCKCDKVYFRPAGIDFNTFSPGDKMWARKKLGLPMERKIILFVGRIVEFKGPQYLVRALPLLNKHLKVTLVIVGNGEYMPTLKSLINKAGVSDQVIIKGDIPNSDLPDIYRAADLFVLPSEHEGFGVVNVEAMACGVPIVGTNQGGVPDIVELFNCGVLVPPKDSKALAEAIVKVLSNLESYKPNIEKARQFLDWKFIIKERKAIYNDLLDNRAS